MTKLLIRSEHRYTVTTIVNHKFETFLDIREINDYHVPLTAN